MKCHFGLWHVQQLGVWYLALHYDQQISMLSGDETDNVKVNDQWNTGEMKNIALLLFQVPATAEIVVTH